MNLASGNKSLKIVVIGNQVQFERLRTTLDEIAAELRRLICGTDVDDELLAPIRTAVEIIEGFADSRMKQI
jgi:hypothetical protein